MLAINKCPDHDPNGVFTISMLRVTPVQTLTDSEMNVVIDRVINILEIIPKADFFTVSPIEIGKKKQGKHFHVHWLNHSLTDNQVQKHLAKAFGEEYRRFIKVQGISYKRFNSSDTDVVIPEVLRYPWKTGINYYYYDYFTRDRPDDIPSWFDCSMHAELAQHELEYRIYEAEKKRRKEEEYKGAHGGNYFKAAMERHDQKPFVSWKEIFMFLTAMSVTDPDCVTISPSRTAEIANKISLKTGVVSLESYADAAESRYCPV